MLGFRLKGPFEVTRGHEWHEIAPITHADAATEFTTMPRPDMQSGPGHHVRVTVLFLGPVIVHATDFP